MGMMNPMMGMMDPSMMQNMMGGGQGEDGGNNNSGGNTGGQSSGGPTMQGGGQGEDGGIGAEIYQQAYGMGTSGTMYGAGGSSYGPQRGGGGSGAASSSASPYAGAGGVGRQTGKVIKFVADRGFGYIAPTAGSADIFVHRRAVLDNDGNLLEGQVVEYNTKPDRQGKGLEADAVRVIGG